MARTTSRGVSCWRRRISPTCSPSPPWMARRTGWSSWRREHPGRLLDEAGRVRHHRARGHLPLAAQLGTSALPIGKVTAQQGVGNSSIVGIGGDPVPCSDFIDIISLFQDDPETELIVMCGEIGGDAEERAADFIADHVTKPVVAYIAGFTAPPGKTMGHAGAIVSGSRGTAKAKAEALESKGVRVGRTPTEMAELT